MENIVFEVYSWGASRNGISENKQYITRDKEYFVDNNRVKTLSDDEYDKVIKFIQEKMIGHNFKSGIIYDYGCKVNAFFEQEEICVSNVIPLYKDALLLFKSISGQEVTAEDISKVENEYQRDSYFSKKNEIVEKSIFYIEKRHLGINYEENLTMVTNDKLLYTARHTEDNRPGDDLKDPPTYDIKRIRELSDDEYDRIIEYIQNNLIGKQYEYKSYNDSTSYAVYVRYNGNIFNSHSNKELYENCDMFLREQIKFD